MQAYTQRRKTGAAPDRAEAKAQGPSMQELAAGAQPSREQMGHRVDLPDAIREKMEISFGADFSNVKLYESETVAEAGAQAMTQGSNIAFAPGQLNLASTAGQALLGHELSHVVSQSRGESAGQGFLNDAHLEAQADMQGEMAAQGESVYQGPVSPIGASSTASAAGPMQAKKPARGGGGRSARRSGGRSGGLGGRFRRVLGGRFGGGGGAAEPDAFPVDEEPEPGEVRSRADLPRHDENMQPYSREWQLCWLHGVDPREQNIFH